jgi:hypothetical protein
MWSLIRHCPEKMIESSPGKVDAIIEEIQG